MKLWGILHKKRIYADAAAATPLSKHVQAEITRLMGLYGNPGGLHKEAIAAKYELDRARDSIASTLGAHSDEIIFTASGTEANNLAIFGALRTILKEHGELHAITTTIEHASILEPLYALEDEGLYITLLPVDANGLVDPKVLKEAISDETVFVSVQTINSEIGVMQDIHELAKEIRHARKERKNDLPIYFHTDAAQAPLWMKLGVDQLGVDLMTLDAQKIMGPKGVGVLYARRGINLTPLIYGGGQEKGLRSGTENVVLAGAMAVALKDAQTGVDERVVSVTEVRDFLFSEISRVVPETKCNGAVGERCAANNINVYIPHPTGDMAVVALDAGGVAASTRSACDTEDEGPSHVLAAIGRTAAEAKNSIRMTLLPDATKREARRIVKILSEVAARYSQK